MLFFQIGCLEGYLLVEKNIIVFTLFAEFSGRLARENKKVLDMQSLDASFFV